MGADLLKADAFVRELVRWASERVGTDLERLCLRGPDRELTRTRNLQPLLVCVSLGYWRQLTERGVQPDVVLGHSLGEISALAAAGIASAGEAVDIAARRGALMDEAASTVQGGMLAVVSSERERVLHWVAGEFPDDQLVLANDNAPNQFVLSGERDALERTARFVADEKLGSCRKLPVSGPWHSPFLRQAQYQFGAWLVALPFHPPCVPILCNASATPENDPATIRERVVNNLTGPVRWRQCMEWLKGHRAHPLLEVGPGRVLSGLARANGFGDDARLVNVNNLHGVDQAAREVYSTPA